MFQFCANSGYRVSRVRWVGISTVSRVRFRIRVNVSFKMIHA